MPKTMNEVKDFMERERLADFATVNDKGEPCIVPVFFTYDNGKAYVQTSRNSVKVRNVLRSHNVALSVIYREEAVILRGIAKIVGEDEFVGRTSDHVKKYNLKLNAHGRDSLGIPLFDKSERCIIEVEPKRFLFW